MHNASLVQLGSTKSNHKVVSRHDADPATFKAGLAVSVDSNLALTLTKSGLGRIGISLGRNLSNTTRATAVVRKGELVPIRLALKRATGVITISSYANLVSGTDDSVSIGGTALTAQAGAATPGDATFQAATSNNATAISLAAQINAHSTISAKVYAAVTATGVVTLYSKVAGIGSTGTGNDIAVSYTDNDTNVGITLSGLSGGKLSGGSNTASDIAYVAKGAKVYINDATGEADQNISGFTTLTDAVYREGIFSSLEEDGTAGPPVAIVDMIGGL